MKLGKIIDHAVVVAEPGAPVFRFNGITLFNPTEETFFDLGFTALPTANPAAGYHDEYSVATRTVKKTVTVTVYTGTKTETVGQNGEMVVTRTTVPQEVTEERDVIEEYIVATAVKDPELSDSVTEVKKYSKLKIVDGLIAEGIWKQVKAYIQLDEDNWDRFNQSQDFESDYELFTNLVGTLREMFPNVDADAILEQAEI